MPTEASSHPMKMLLFGAGGHARVVADAYLSKPDALRLLASDRNDSLCVGELLAGVPLIRLSSLNGDYGSVHVAIGDNASREKESHALGMDRLVSVLHPDSTASRHARVEPGCFVAAQAVVAPGATLARGVIVNHAAVVDHDCVVGAFVHIASCAVLGGGSRIGSRVLLGSGSVVLPGVSICDDAVIGAGAVVCRTITQAGTYAGVPARRIS